MKRLSYIILALLSIITAAGSADDQFRVNGTIEGKPTMNLRAGYYADGKYKTVITAVREGEFEFFGSAGQPSILEITDYDYRPIARLYVVNGETYDVSLEQGRPYSVKASGNPVNERWSEFLRTNEKSLLTAVPTKQSHHTSHRIPTTLYPLFSCSPNTMPRSISQRPIPCFPRLHLPLARRRLQKDIHS